MNDRLILIGASGVGKSSAALGFMDSPATTAIIQHKGSQGFRYIATLPTLKTMMVRNVANFGDFGTAVQAALTDKRKLIIVDDYDYLFRDEQRSARAGKTGNAQRLASQTVYQQVEGAVKALMESDATVVFTLKAVASSAEREGDATVINIGPFLPGLHAHIETGLVDAVLHLIRSGPKYLARSRPWEVVDGSTVRRYYAKVTLGLGDFLPESIMLEKPPGKPYSRSIRDAIAKAKDGLAAAWNTDKATGKADDPPAQEKPDATG